MARTSAVEAVQTLERGSITFLYRPRVEEQHPGELGDVQRVAREYLHPDRAVVVVVGDLDRLDASLVRGPVRGPRAGEREDERSRSDAAAATVAEGGDQ